MKIKNTKQILLSPIRSVLETIGSHPFALGVLSVVGLIGFYISIQGYLIDRKEAEATTQQIEELKEIVFFRYGNGVEAPPPPKVSEIIDLSVRYPGVSKEDLATEIVILLQGKNGNDDDMYAYLKTPLLNIYALRDAIISMMDFKPSNYGEVLKSGIGPPPPEIKAEMAEKYGLVDMKPTNTCESSEGNTNSC